MAKHDPNMIIITDPYGRQKTILTNHLPKTPRFFGDGHQEQLDGLLTYQFATLASDPATVHLEAGNHVIVRNKDRKLMLFTIIRTREERRDGKYIRTVFAENAAVDDLYTHIVAGELLTAVSAKDAATKVLEGTGWKLGMIDYAGLQNIDLNEYPTALAALHKIRDTYGLEMEFTVNFVGTQVRERFVHLVKKRGNVSGKRFTYGKDLLGVTREVDRSDLATAIIPVGKSDETGKRLTIEAFENIHDGYVSPKGQNWVGDDNALQQFGKNGKHLFKRLDLSSVDNEYELMKLAVEELRRVMKPRMTYEVSVLLLEQLTGYKHEKVRLGDTILVKDATFEPALAVQARVIEIYRSYTDPTKDSVVLGEFVPIIIDKNKQIEAIQNTINQNMSKWEQGGEVVYKNINEPALKDRTPDMLWLDLSKTPNVMRRWDTENKRWVNASVTTAEEIGAETPKGAQDKADKAEEVAIAEAAEDAAIKAKQAEDNAVEKAEEMDESVKIELKSYVEGLTEEVEAAVKEHADQVAKDAELNAQIFTEGYAEKEFHYGNTPPEDTTQLWFDLSTNPNKIRRYDEASKTWVAASPTSPSDIGAASTQDVIDEANKAREEAIKKAKEEAKAAQDAAIKEAKELDAAIKSEAERLSQAAERAANDHTNSVTQQVEESLKQDSQNKADQAKEGALSEADKRIQEAKAESAKDAQAKADAARKAAEEAAKKHTSEITATVEENAKQHADDRAKAAEEAAKTFTQSYAQKEIKQQNTAPTDTSLLWLDTSKDPNILKRYDATAKKWINASPTSASQIGAETPEGAKSKADAAQKAAETAAKADAQSKADAAKQAAISAAATDAASKSEAAKQAAIADAKLKAEAAQAAAIKEAAAKAAAAEAAAKAHTDGKVSDEEAARIKQAADNLAAAKKEAADKAAAAESAAKTAAAADAKAKADAAQAAAAKDAQAKADAAKAAAAADAKAKADAAEKAAKEAAAIDASNKASAAQAAAIAEAQKKADAAKQAAITAAAADAKTKADAAQKAATDRANTVEKDVKEFASNAGNITKGTIAAERLYGGTIDAGKANIVNINAGNITAGTLDASRIKAGSIGVDLIEFGGRLRNVSGNAPTTYSSGDLVANGMTGVDSTAVPRWMVKQFPATATVDLGNIVGEVVRVGFTTYYTTDARYIPKSFKLETSMNNTTWEVVADVTNNTVSPLSYTFGGRQVRYVRLTIREAQPSQTTVNIANFEVMATQGGSILTGDSILTGTIDANRVSVKNLKAESIVSGTIDATKISVINLNANNVTTGTLDANKVNVTNLKAQNIASGTLDASKITVANLSASVLQTGVLDASKVTVNNLDASKITTGTLSADKVKGGSIDANNVNIVNLKAGNITSGTIDAAKIGVTNIKAENITAGTLNAARIAANAITTDKLHVLAKSLVANTSLTGNDSTGWGVSKHATSTIGLRGSANMGDVLVHGFTTADHDQPTLYNSEFFEVDPNQTYKFSIGMFLDKNPRDAAQYFGLNAYDKNMKEIPMQPLNPTNGALSGDPRTNVYFWSGKEVSGAWRSMEGYAVSSQSGGNEAPQGRNIQSSYRMHPATKYLRMRFYSGYYPTVKNVAMEVLWHSPSVSPVDSGTIIADRITAGTIDASKVNVTKINASNITTGGMSADRVTSGTIDARKISVIGLNAGNIVAGSINAATIDITNLKAQNITSGTLHADRIGAGAINADKLATNSVTAVKILAGNITAEKIAANAVTAEKIIANAVTADKIAANAVTAAKIAANSIDAGKIAAGSITTDKIAAAGITADKITSGVLDANRVQVKNLNASVITAGTMSADRITGGTINATNTNIINLKAQNIASGTINADNVAISNGRVTINKDGVTVTNAHFLVKDAITGLLHTTISATNLLYDHSFETLKADGAQIGGVYNVIATATISADINDSFHKWARVGTPRMVDALSYDVPTEAAPYGLRAALVNQPNYVAQRFSATASKQYTISFHAGKPFGGLAAGAPRLIIEHMKDNTVVHSETKDFAVPNANVGEVVRFGHTITASAGIAGGRSSSIRVRFLTTNANWCVIDGVQAVVGNKAAPYDADDSLFKAGQGRVTMDMMDTRRVTVSQWLDTTQGYIRAKDIRGKYKDAPIIRDHENQNVTISALGNDLYLGYYDSKKVIVHNTTNFEVNSPETRVNGSFLPQKGINIQGKNATGNAMDAAGNINTWSGNIKAQDGDVLTNWAVKAAGFTFMQHNTPIWAGEGTMWYGWQGSVLGLWIFASGSYRLIWENKWTAG
ncbi:Phage minor structural protein [Bacillus cereus]|nr:Phage minor structural protein [Bacillus cereus]